MQDIYLGEEIGDARSRGYNAFYGDSHILHGVDLTLGSSDRVSILGRNGSGKTTLMKSILNAGPGSMAASASTARTLPARTPSDGRASVFRSFRRTAGSSAPNGHGQPSDRARGGRRQTGPGSRAGPQIVPMLGPLAARYAAS